MAIKKIKIHENIPIFEEKLKRISAWWKGGNIGRPLLYLGVSRNKPSINLNKFWKSAEIGPDLEKMVDTQIESISKTDFLADAYPALGHFWGSRGTPMTMAAYLGGKVILGEETVWIEPSVDNWEKFEMKFDEKNCWFSISKKLMETQLRKYDGTFLIHLPDFGDALTVFSLLRGVEELLIDLVKRPKIIKIKIKEFVSTWIKIHQNFWTLYKEKLPGDCSWLLWAPGKTYACQCDFSTMISPGMFKEFVVPEIEELGKYLDFMAWHLDGPEEIKHLDILLELPQIKAIQITPGTGKPPCVSSLWLPQMKKIHGKGKLVFADASNKKDVEILLSNLLPEKLLLYYTSSFSDIDEANNFINWVENISKRHSRNRVQICL